MQEILLPFDSTSRGLHEILVERTRFKNELPLLTELLNYPFQPQRFMQGVPLLCAESLTVLTASWETRTSRLIDAMRRSFPIISEHLDHLEEALNEGRLDPTQCMAAMFNGREDEILRMAAAIESDSRTFRFILGQFLKPCIEKRAVVFRVLIEDLEWGRSYCPICGSAPELGFVKRDSKERWLLCSLCGHQWLFAGNMCPFCENFDQDQMEFLSIQGHEYQCAELCHTCKRYLVILDLDKCQCEVAPEVASRRVAYLDIVAQRAGFLPVAVCSWNMLHHEEIEPTSPTFALNDRWNVH